MYVLRAGTAQVWLIRLDLAPAQLRELEHSLDDTERRRADGLLTAVDRRRFVVAHGAVRRILARYLDIAPERIAWRLGANGKPQVDGLQINLSHSADLAALAVSGRRGVGVDIQWCAPDLPATRLSQRFFPAQEARFVAAGRDTADAVSRFVRLWARKEAVVKAAGGRVMRGLGLPVGGSGAGRVVYGPPLPGPYRVRDLAAPRGFHAAVALQGVAGFQVLSRWWDHHDLEPGGIDPPVRRLALANRPTGPHDVTMSPPSTDAVSDFVMSSLRALTESDSAQATVITPETLLETDLQLESIDLLQLAGVLRERYGAGVDLVGYVAGLDLDEIIGLRVGDVVAHVRAGAAS